MIQFDTPTVCVFESALFRTTSTVIQTPDLVLIVDPTWLPAEVAAIQRFVEPVHGERPVYLLFTHSDYDHILGYHAFPNTTVIASAAFVTQPDQAAIVQQMVNFDAEYYIQRSYKIEYPKVDYVVKEDGQCLRIGDTTFTFYLAPGHNSDGLFTLVQFADQCIWIAGDYVSNIEFPFIYYSSYEYEQTLAKAERILLQNKIDLLIPGHGDIATEEKEMQLRITESYRYMQQLRDFLQTGIEFPTDQLWKRYQFPIIQQKYHDENVALMRRELGMAH
jgi:glyoxylase-like metal-dependent hydrolase (beta-lactamase superfamily II)